MEYNKLSLNTFIPETPKLINNNFDIFKRYIDTFYNETSKTITSSINTTGNIKGNTGTFINVVTDNLTVKSQFTNLYENINTANLDWVNTYNGSVITTRNPSTFENQTCEYIDVNKPYYKIDNSKNYGLKCGNLSQIVGLIMTKVNEDNFNILIDPSENTFLTIPVADVSNGNWVELININYDNSIGSFWKLYSKSFNNA